MNKEQLILTELKRAITRYEESRDSLNSESRDNGITVYSQMIHHFAAELDCHNNP